MTITQLEYIIAVDRNRNFAKAAKKCHVTQPTLSMQIKKLEESLDTLIFDRNQTPVKPTEIGRKILDQAQKVIDSKNKVKEIINDYKGIVSGEVKVGVIPTVSPYLLPMIVSEFMEENPDVTLKVDEMMTEEIIAKLHNEELDVGILVTPTHEETLNEFPLYYELFVAYTSSKHPIWDKDKVDYDDLEPDEMWLLKEGHCFRHQALNICKERSSSKYHKLQFQSGSIETVKRIVENQYGYTLIPELATLDFSEKEYEHVRHFNPPQPVREISLITSKSYYKSGIVELLRKTIQKSVPELLLNEDRGKIIEWKS